MTSAELCQLAADYRGTLPPGGAMAEEKFDGWRGLRFPGIDGKVRLWTRGGFAIEGAGHILHHLDLMERVAGEPLFFDGEFQVDGTLLATKTWCERGWKQGSEAGVLHLFDAIPLADWKRGRCDIPLYQRKRRIEAFAGAVEQDPALSWEWRPGSRGRDEAGPIPVHVVADEWISEPGDVLDMARRVWARGGEGCVLKDAESPYVRGRCPAWLKVKQCNISKWRKAA